MDQLPEVYQVVCPSLYDKEFIRLMKIACPKDKIGATYKYYKVENGHIAASDNSNT